MPEKRILVAHGDQDYLPALIYHLQDRGYEVVGPASTARMALALAAQAPFGRAIIGQQLAGRRNGTALAEALAVTWGVPSMVIDRPDPETLAL